MTDLVHDKDASGKKSSFKKESRPSSSSKKVILFGLVVVAAIFGGIGIWASVAPLAKAIYAPAVLTVKGERKKIQHFEGGIVSKIFVAEGQFVKKGQTLIQLDSVQAKAGLARFRKQLDHELARRARLQAEANDLNALTLSDDILERVTVNPSLVTVIEAEQVQFFARKKLLDGQVAVLEQRLSQFKKEIEGLKVQRKSRSDQLKVFQEEIIGLRDLNQKGFYPKSQLLAMERAMIQLRGFIGSDTASIARSESGMGETQRQIINLKQQVREQSLEQLRVLQVNIADLKERVTVAQEILNRINIRTPKAGIIQDLRVHTVGGIIKPGEKLMDIVPQNEELIVEAQVLPVDIDSLVVGQKAEVRLTALNMRLTPTIYGAVVAVSGDALVTNSDGKPYFLAQIKIPDEEREKLGSVRLSAGMPAEVLIQTGERTALDYFIKPLSDAFVRGLNEE